MPIETIGLIVRGTMDGILCGMAIAFGLDHEVVGTLATIIGTDGTAEMLGAIQVGALGEILMHKVGTATPGGVGLITGGIIALHQTTSMADGITDGITETNGEMDSTMDGMETELLELPIIVTLTLAAEYPPKEVHAITGQLIAHDRV
jgi:hypothetical protein